MRRLCLALLVVLAAVYLATSSPEYYRGDDRYYLNVARSLLERGSVALDRQGRSGPHDPDSSFIGADGRLYSKYPVGHSLVLAAFMGVARAVEPLVPPEGQALTTRLILALAPALAIAGAIALAALAASRLGYAPATCVAWALAMGLATNLWPASKPLLSEPSQTFFLTLAGVILMSLARVQTASRAAWAGVAVAALMLMKPTHGLSALVALAVAWGPPERRRWRLVAVAAPIAAGICLIGLYNLARSGTVLIHGYEAGQDQILRFSTPLPIGLYNLLISPGKGLFFYSPFLILALLGAPRFFRRHRRECLVVAALTVPHLAIHAMWNSWHGDWSWGPRYLAPIHPLAGLLALPLLKRLMEPGRGRWALGAVLGAGLAVQLLGVVLDPFQYIMEIHKLPLALSSTKLGDVPAGAPFVLDDLLFNHFVPPFSPIAGHAWGLARLLGLAGAGYHPWAYLDVPALIPEPWTPVLDLWWTAWRNGPEERIGRAILALLALAIGGGLVALARWARRPQTRLEGAPADDPCGSAGSGPGGIETGGGAVSHRAPWPPWLDPWRLTLLALIVVLSWPVKPDGISRESRIFVVLNLLAGVATSVLVARSVHHLSPGSVAVGRVLLGTVPLTMLFGLLRGPGLVWPALLAAALVTERLCASRDRDRQGADTLVAVGLITLVCWGGIQARAPAGSCPPFWVGLIALLIAPGKSLVLYNPVILLAGTGGRRWPDLAPRLAAVVVAVIVAEAMGGAWVNDPSWGPIGLVAAIPPLLVLASPALERIDRTCAAVLALSLAVSLAGVLVEPSTYLAMQLEVPLLSPPSRPQVRDALADRLLGAEFVPELSPLVGQLWLVPRAIVGAEPRGNPPWKGLFFRGFEPRRREPIALDLAILDRRFWTASARPPSTPAPPGRRSR